MLGLLNRPEFLVLLFIFMLIFIWIGRKNRMAILKEHPKDSGMLGPVESVIFALLGLLLAFTFTSSWSRFEERRKLITAETKAISSAYLRIDLLPKEAQAPMRYLMKQYTSLRTTMFQETAAEPLSHKYDRAKKLRQEMWDLAISEGSKQGADSFSMYIILPSISLLSDVAIDRMMARQNHPPLAIYIMLIILSLFSAFLVGYSMPQGGSRFLYTVSYAAAISAVLYLIIEMEMPRHGFITVNENDQMLIDLRESM